MRSRRIHPARALALLALAIALAPGCSGDPGTTQPEGNPETEPGFACEYRRGACMGINGCITEGDGFANAYEHEVWCDWWDPMAAEVDSAVFFVAIRISVWGNTPAEGCSGRSSLTALIGQRFGDHWRAYSPVGYYMVHEGFGVYSCGEFLPEPIDARIVYRDGRDSTFTATPTPR